MCSINQLNAKITLAEMWKVSNSNDNSYNKKKLTKDVGARCSRAATNGDFQEEGKPERAKDTFINDATRAWNKAPDNIKHFNSIYSAKKAIKIYVKSMPI